jgi:exodeoxyribonuclease VII large subunit
MDSDIKSEVILEVSDFVALVNQTLEYAYSAVVIRGELANFRISKNKWVYFDLKDQSATVRFFGSVYQLKGPLEDGLMLRVRGTPKLHPLYGFSVTVTNMQPEGEGSLKRAADLLRMKLQAEGLFDQERKRPLLYPPVNLGLITSFESAAYIDFMKILNERWRGITIECADVQVQGEIAPEQIVNAIEYFNQKQQLPDVIVITRGGGSPEDLFAFNTEQVTRAVAASRIPTMVAIGHERDISLAELAADQRASTPSNAAELLVPDRKEVLRQLELLEAHSREVLMTNLHNHHQHLNQLNVNLERLLTSILQRSHNQLITYSQLLESLNPKAILGRGYAIVRKAGDVVIRHKNQVKSGDIVDIELSDGHINTIVR